MERNTDQKRQEREQAMAEARAMWEAADRQFNRGEIGKREFEAMKAEAMAAAEWAGKRFMAS